MTRLAKVKVASAFYDREGRVKVTGPLSALPFNPHPYDRCPRFKVQFNGKWIEVELLDACDTYGFLAQSSPKWNDPFSDATPKVEIRRTRETA